MIVRKSLEQKARFLRLGLFVSFAVMAAPMFFPLQRPYSYSSRIGLSLLVETLMTAYRMISGQSEYPFELNVSDLLS